MPQPAVPPSVRVAERVIAGLPVLVARMGDLYREQVPEYRALSEELMRAEVLPVSARIVEGFFEAVVARREPRPEEIAEVEWMGRRRLEMGMPLEPILHVYRIAGRAVWDAIVAATPAGEERLLADLGARWMDYIDRAASSAAAAYLEASHERVRSVDARRGALIQGLLAADTAAEVAAVATEHGTTFAPAYAPVLVAGPDAASRIETVLAAVTPATLAGLRGEHLLLLVPGGPPDVHALAASWPAGVVAWGHAAPTGRALAAEVVAVEAVLGAARVCGGQGAFGPDDLSVERLVLADRRVASTLAARTAPLLAAADRTGMLRTTLAAYLATGSMPATATAESVHPNTVAYRLRRVAEVTGLDPRVPGDAAMLVLGLTASRLLGNSQEPLR